MSSYGSKLDFCSTTGTPARPLVNVSASGSLQLRRIFLRNFLPSEPQDLSTLGPVPALLSSGGLVSFKHVTFHFLPAVTWVLNASAARPGFWALNQATALANLYTLQPPQLEQPAVYRLTYKSPPGSTARYHIHDSYAPFDLHSCYGNDREDTALVYCAYTLAESLRNPAVRYGRIFHDIGLDRAALSLSKPVILSTPKSYSACPKSVPSINLDGVVFGVVVRSQLNLTDLLFKGSLSNNYTSWPPALPVLLSLFDVQEGGTINISNSVMEVADLGATVARLQALPGCCTTDPSRPNLQPYVDAWPTQGQLAEAERLMRASPPPGGSAAVTVIGAWPLAAPPAPPLTSAPPQPPSTAAAAPPPPSAAAATSMRPGFIITHWDLQKSAWARYAMANLYETLATQAAASWRFDNVLVQQANRGVERALCFSAALEQGFTTRDAIVPVANEVEFRAALMSPTARYIQIVGYIKFTEKVWLDQKALVPMGRMVEVRGCHPVMGERYTIDSSDLLNVIMINGSRLIFEGDLRFVGVGWIKLPQSLLLPIATGAVDMPLVGSLALEADGNGVRGSAEFEGAAINGVINPNGLRPVDMLTILHLSHITPAMRAINVTLYGVSGVMLGIWTVSEDGTSDGLWVFTQTELSWSSTSGLTEPFQTPTVDVVGGDEDIKQIVVPCVVVGGVLLIALVVVGILYARHRVHTGDCPCIGPGKDGAKCQAEPTANGQGTTAKTVDGPMAAGVPTELQTSLSSSVEQAITAGRGGGEGGGGGAAAAASVPLNSLATDPASATALAAVIQAATKIMNASNPDSTASASGTKADGSGAAGVLAALALLERVRVQSERLQQQQQQPAATTTTSPVAAGLRTGSDDGAAVDAAVRGEEKTSPAAALQATKDKDPLKDINAVRRAIMAGRPMPNPDTASQLDDLVLLNVLGEGSYGRVYRALWRGTAVAVKVILLPQRMSGRERHQRMAVMEAAISSSLSHPNIVQTYTYAVEAVDGPKKRAMGTARSNQSNTGMSSSSMAPVNGGPAVPPNARPSTTGQAGGAAEAEDDTVGWEIRLVQELCDLGSLRDKLNSRAFFKPAPAAADGFCDETAAGPPAGPAAALPPQAADAAADAVACGPSRGRVAAVIVDLAAVLDTAIDVARALTHLHREGILHADLKPRNVLLKGSTTDSRGFVAKVADFGLSIRLDPNETHVSNSYHGTLAYMAPETLLRGQVSKASDVYGFGILLYELYTGETAFRGVPKALIGHAITKENLRPVFPAALGAPFEYQLLACRCWESNPEIRPEFNFILDDLERMRNRLCSLALDYSSTGPWSGANGYGPGAFPAMRSRLAGGGGMGGDGGGGLLGGTAAGGAGEARWGATPQKTSQGLALMTMTMAHTGPNFTDGERTLSVSNSITISARSATAVHSTPNSTVPASVMADVARHLMAVGSVGRGGAGCGGPWGLGRPPGMPYGTHPRGVEGEGVVVEEGTVVVRSL